MTLFPIPLLKPFATACPKCGSERHFVRSRKRDGSPCLTPICLPCRRRYRAAVRQKLGGASAANRDWKERNPEKYRAHKKVEARLRRGTWVKKPCERCGASEIVHAHHDDYSRPLDVMWLCPTHHAERHHELAQVAV